MPRLRGDRTYEFARRFHALSVWKDEPFDVEAVAGFVDALEAREDAFYEITDHGLVGGILVPLWFAPSTLLAVELFWYSEEKGEGQRLKARFEAWAREHNATYTQFSAMTNERESALRRVMAKAGYNPIEIGFRKAL